MIFLFFWFCLPRSEALLYLDMIGYAQVSAFTETPGHGNQAGVVLDAGDLRGEEMLAFARRLGMPETAFVVRARLGGVVARFFTPTQEIDFCGHATVALGLVLAQRGRWQGGELTLSTNAGPFFLRLELERGVPKRVWMRQRELQLRPVARGLRGRIARSLGIDERLLHGALPLVSASTGLWTVCVPLIDGLIVDALEPDLGEIAALSKELNVTGLHAYAFTGPTTLYTRDFSPRVGIPEDPVTGSAAGALVGVLAALGKLPRRGDAVSALCLQGHALETPGEVHVEVTLRGDLPQEVRVGGCAVLEREGRL